MYLEHNFLHLIIILIYSTCICQFVVGRFQQCFYSALLVVRKKCPLRAKKFTNNIILFSEKRNAKFAMVSASTEHGKKMMMTTMTTIATTMNLPVLFRLAMIHK